MSFLECGGEKCSFYDPAMPCEAMVNTIDERAGELVGAGIELRMTVKDLCFRALQRTIEESSVPLKPPTIKEWNSRGFQVISIY